MSTKLTYTGAEVQELLDKIEKGDFDNAKTLEGHPASYFAIASEFTSLAESFATEQGRVNTLYSYFNNGSANDALSLGGKLPSYYATATQYEILQRTLSDFKSLFDSMFEKDSDGNIHAKLSLWSSGGITAGGVGSGGSGGGGISYNRLDSWSDYSADKAGYVLSALLGKDLDNRVSALANAGYITASYLAPYALRSEIPSLVGYATESFVTSQGYITQSALGGYATQGWVGDNYLSLSGGTLTDALTVKGSGSPLTVHRTQSLASVVKFVNTDGVLGWLGVDVDKTAIFMTASGVIKKLLHSGNYSDYTLSINGGTVNGSITATSFIGNLTGKANSATKLATPRTIWGQSFDGTGDITGDIMFAGPNKIAWHNDKNYYYISSPTTSTSAYLEYNAYGGHSFLGGNVTIGGGPSYEKLHVHGNGKFEGSVTASSLTIGGATITYDSVNKALCINGNMYALGGIAAGAAGISAYTSLEARVARLEQQLNIA